MTPHRQRFRVACNGLRCQVRQLASRRCRSALAEMVIVRSSELNRRALPSHHGGSPRGRRLLNRQPRGSPSGPTPRPARRRTSTRRSARPLPQAIRRSRASSPPTSPHESAVRPHPAHVRGRRPRRAVDRLAQVVTCGGGCGTVPPRRTFGCCREGSQNALVVLEHLHELVEDLQPLPARTAWARWVSRWRRDTSRLCFRACPWLRRAVSGCQGTRRPSASTMRMIPSRWPCAVLSRLITVRW